MSKLTAADLLSLEAYARERTAFRARVMAHRRSRTVALGPHLRLLFEDRLTVQYQVQEMLRIERIFEPEAIAAELAAYNPLIPEGRDWRATCLIEVADPAERRRRLVEWRGIEDLLEIEVEGWAPIRAIANEDLGRPEADKTSAVHFLRFPLSAEAITALRAGALPRLRARHPAYRHQVTLTAACRTALLADLE